MKIKWKKIHIDAVAPFYSKEGDGALDLTAVSADYDEWGNLSYNTGVGMEIPKGYVGLVFPRSSVVKLSMSLANCVAVIDSNYRGAIIVKYKPTMIYPKKPVKNAGVYIPGDRVGQLIIVEAPEIELEEVEELSESVRGDGAFGSSGK